ncbi:ABC transporter ATP-binding protein [Anaerocolumna sp. AGMB13025]|uniref:ATP-binding cassette domain-containing protein n=1 Tax=Anaerocolumna sp. AGMB13025 TaxID=3039116 RepID=UPI00241DA70E|nr:ABC transporter ATP-binding protein [Anaerocolumna sp. AGMB13025]WFR57089.1 ABC transporter ATP-binding protein [Anaerocolumna sp. AGMB13025]
MTKKSILENNFFVLRFYYKHAPVYSFLTMFNTILQRVSFVLLLQYSLMFVIDNIEKGKQFKNVIAIITGVFLFSVIVTFIDRFLVDYYMPKTTEKLNSIMQSNLFTVSKHQNAENYDNAEFYSKYHDAMINSEQKLSECFNNMVDIMANIVSVALLGALFVKLSTPGLVIILITYILSLINNIKNGKFTYSVDIKKRRFERENQYINKIFYLPEYLLEFVLGNLIYNGILLFQVISLKTLTIGGFSALYFASSSISSNISGLQSSIMKFSKLANYIDDIRKFLNTREEWQEGVLFDSGTKDNFDIKDVSYKYYNNTEPALKNISMNIPYGNKIAIVGTNGAGKTTFVKLLLRLYKLQSGQIKLGQQPIETIDLESYRKVFGTVLQEFNIYALPLIENVIMDQAVDHSLQDKVRATLENTGFFLNDNFTDDLNIRLTNEFDINDKSLSGGQQQKVAISRVLYEEKNYIILDEPSSALDPLAEYNFNKTVSNYSEQKTVIMISHRLSTTKNADIIYVFDNGSVVEVGQHDELMRLGGLYKKMFIAQAEKYV